MSFVEVKNLFKTYKTGQIKVEALKNTNFEINKGEICVIVGASGAGKTTLLNILGGMDSPSMGEVILDGETISSYNDKKLTMYRRQNVGFVFQFYNLIQNLTALENIEIACKLAKNPLDASETLDRVGLSNRAGNFPAQLSGGEQQRVAIARAIAKNPKILLCDEPTGALDYITGKSILALLHEMSRTYGMTVVIITHNTALTSMADRVIHMNSGTVTGIELNSTPMDVSLIEW